MLGARLCAPFYLGTTTDVWTHNTEMLGYIVEMVAQFTTQVTVLVTNAEEICVLLGRSSQTRGLGKVEREQCPLPHHIRRLAAQLSPEECRQVTICLGLKVEQWYDLEYQFQHQPSNDLKFMALWSSTIRSRHLCFNDLKNVLDNIGLNPHLLCQVYSSKS
ncbi:unnamed protein product [Mytilus edulis]|uniref:Uncharacterized protein n=1 Tax=Mytilus edulis TaxID=6550 RepID=A0A8S3QQ22_MYTED|nr:unnamed protein product [Mytilus edulis]